MPSGLDIYVKRSQLGNDSVEEQSASQRDAAKLHQRQQTAKGARFAPPGLNRDSHSVLQGIVPSQQPRPQRQALEALDRGNNESHNFGTDTDPEFDDNTSQGIVQNLGNQQARDNQENARSLTVNLSSVNHNEHEARLTQQAPRDYGTAPSKDLIPEISVKKHFNELATNNPSRSQRIALGGADQSGDDHNSYPATSPTRTTDQGGSASPANKIDSGLQFSQKTPKLAATRTKPSRSPQRGPQQNGPQVNTFIAQLQAQNQEQQQHKVTPRRQEVSHLMSQVSRRDNQTWMGQAGSPSKYVPELSQRSTEHDTNQNYASGDETRFIRDNVTVPSPPTAQSRAMPMGQLPRPRDILSSNQNYIGLRINHLDHEEGFERSAYEHHSEASLHVQEDDDDTPDYSQEKLFSMSYDELASQSFDYDPNMNISLLPEIIRDSTLQERLEYARDQLLESDQDVVLSSLAFDQWEEAGEWFVQQFADLMRKIVAARQNKRKAAVALEEEITARNEAVERKKQRLEEVIKDMKSGGESLLKTPGKN